MAKPIRDLRAYGRLTPSGSAGHDEGMPEANSPPPQPTTDSPLFWLLLFGSTALIMLAVIEPKFAKRQERLERMSQSRVRAAQNIAAGDTKPRDPDDAATPRWEAERRPTLQPLILFIGFVVLASSLVMRFTAGRRATRSSQAEETKTPSHGEAAS